MKTYTFTMNADMRTEFIMEDNSPRYVMTQYVYGPTGIRISSQTLTLTEQFFHDTISMLRSNVLIKETTNASENV